MKLKFPKRLISAGFHEPRCSLPLDTADLGLV